MDALPLILSFVYAFFFLIFYVYNAICLMAIAKKTAVSNGWMAWIPILNLYLMCRVAGKSGAWILLLLLPVINIIAIVVLWMAISERCGKPGWWGILMLISPVNFIIMGVLAFSKSPVVPMPPPAAAAPLPSQPQSQIPASGPAGGRRFCSQCGTPIGPADRFCPNCGARM